MKNLLLVALLMAISINSFSQCSVSKVYISSFLADPNSATNNFDTDTSGTAVTNDDEFVQICNDSTGKVALSGWTISDLVGVRYTFATPDTIGPGECLTIVTDWASGSPPSFIRDMNRTSAIWNNGGDDIVLSDGTNSCTVSYPSASVPEQDGCVTVIIGGTASVDCGLQPSDIDNSALPIELLYFKAHYSNNQNVLQWQTASEINNSHFEVQHSVSGNDFQTIGYIPGAGNSSSIQEYEYIDNSTFSQAYYRLKQVDFDGVYAYSKVVKLSKKENGISILDFSNRISIQLGEVEEANYVITNVQGSIIDAGIMDSDIQLDKSDIGRGIYFLRIENRGSLNSIKFVVL